MEDREPENLENDIREEETPPIEASEEVLIDDEASDAVLIDGEEPEEVLIDDGEPAEFTAEQETAPSPAREAAGLMRDIEAVLFISPDPVSLEVLAEVTGAGGEELARAVEAVREKYSDPDGSIMFAEIAGGYTFRTGDLAREAVERFCRRPVDYSLSPAAMETMAIVAYLQPVTRPEIARIRGVGADTVVANLLDKGLVAEAGRAEQTGAVKYRTTEAFEKLFGLVDLADLPSLEGFEATPADVEELREKLHLAADKRQ
ncbi:MAG: SMC-Scp complex subunit ScpB [Thermoleophilia bacterium]